MSVPTKALGLKRVVTLYRRNKLRGRLQVQHFRIGGAGVVAAARQKFQLWSQAKTFPLAKVWMLSRAGGQASPGTWEELRWWLRSVRYFQHWRLRYAMLCYGTAAAMMKTALARTTSSASSELLLRNAPMGMPILFLLTYDIRYSMGQLIIV